VISIDFLITLIILILLRKKDLELRKSNKHASKYILELGNRFSKELIKIKKARQSDEFVTYYQPIIDLNSMKVINAEALIRWKQNSKIVLPTEFIQAAKEAGEMVAIDNWMLESSCIKCKEWHDSGVNDFCISVNTTYKQLLQENFVGLVQEVLKINSLAPMYLNLEITEDEAIECPELILDVLLKLKTLGVKLSLDDFGTGYSSLNYVSKLPIDFLKIDKLLIASLERSSKTEEVIKSIILLAHKLNIKVVAEGIETENQLQILKELECDMVQGYLIGKPMKECEFEDRFIYTVQSIRIN